MLLYISIIGFAVAFLLAINNRNRFVGNYYLVVFFLINSIYATTFYSLYYSPSVKFSAIMHGHFMPFLYLGGPMAFFYVRSLITDHTRLKKKDLLHFIPFFILFIGIIPYYFKDFDYKVALNESFRADHKTFLTNINFLVPQSVNIISRPFIMILYFIMSLRMFIRHKEVVRRKTLLTGLYFKHVYIFVLILLILSMLLSLGVLIYAATTVYRFNTNLKLQEMELFLKIVGSGYFVLNCSLFIFPEILYGLPRYRGHFAQPAPAVIAPTISSTDSPVEIVSTRLQLSTDYLSKIENQISVYILKKPFLDTEFNLTMMSSETEIPTHHLSYYFNNVLEVSFSDWRNRLRVEYATQLIEEGFAKDHSLNAVSLESGFSSQVTFIRAFKNHTGVTPGERLKLVK